MIDLAGWPLVAISALFGLLFGSFANVAIHRWPRRESIVTPRSRCPSCGTEIRSLDNIPVLSWAILRGRCRHCGERISWRYPAVETLVAVIWGLIAAVHGPTAALPALLLLGWALVVVTLIDLEHLIIPNRLTYRLAPIMAVLLVAAAVTDGAWADLRRGLVVAMVLPGGMLLLSEAFRAARGQAGLGMGDVKLAITLGLVLGYLGTWSVVIALYATIITAVTVAFGLIIAGRAKLASRIPFGPYLATGTLIAILAGQPLTDVARRLVGLA